MLAALVRRSRFPSAATAAVNVVKRSALAHSGPAEPSRAAAPGWALRALPAGRGPRQLVPVGGVLSAPTTVQERSLSTEVATVNTAEARAVRVLTGVLSTMLTPMAAAAGTVAGKLSDHGAGQDYANLYLQTGKYGILNPMNEIHSHPSLQHLYDDIIAHDKRATEDGFTLATLSSILERSGGTQEYAKVMMHVLDQDGDGIVSWHEFWAHHVVMEVLHSYAQTHTRTHTRTHTHKCIHGAMMIVLFTVLSRNKLRIPLEGT
jgi:hypothetical protein